MRVSRSVTNIVVNRYVVTRRKFVEWVIELRATSTDFVSLQINYTLRRPPSKVKRRIEIIGE